MSEKEGAKAQPASLVESAIAEVHSEVGTTLYELSDAYELILLEAESVAALGEGEIPEELFDQIADLEEKLEEKVENYIRLYKNMKMKKAMKEAVAQALKASIEPIMDEIKRYLVQASTVDGEMTKLRDRLGERLEVLARNDPDTFLKKLSKKEKEEGKKANPYFKCEFGTAWVQDNPPGIVLAVEPAEVPSKFLHAPAEDWVNKGLLKEAIEDDKHPDHEEAMEIASIDQTRGGRIR